MNIDGLGGLTRMKPNRTLVLSSSKQYYARRAYYLDLLSQRLRVDKETVRESRFLEFAFKKYAGREVDRVLDVACGGGRHIVGLAGKGYECTGQDYTPERLEMARRRADRAKVSVELTRGDATKLDYRDKFDAVLALNILFLLPSDEDAAKCLAGAYRALKTGGVLVCNVYNALATGKAFARTLIDSQHFVHEVRGRGVRITRIEKLEDYDPVLGAGWVHATDIVEAPDGRHVFRDWERFRFFTYWDVANILNRSGFRKIESYPDWKTGIVRKPKAEQLVFVARK